MSGGYNSETRIKGAAQLDRAPGFARVSEIYPREILGDSVCKGDGKSYYLVDNRNLRVIIWSIIAI